MLMKKIITLLLISVSSFGFSQQGELHHEGQPIGATFAIDSSSSTIDHFASDLYIVNTGGVALNISFSRTRRHHQSGWTDQVCDCLICFNADDATVWNRPASPPVSVAPGDSCILQPKVYPHGINGCAIYSYVIEAQNHTFIDSVEVTYTIGGASCFSGNDELKSNEFQFSVYPNPATDVININVENLKGKATVTVYDIVGNEVVNSNLINGKNTLNIESLTSGIYFYTIRKDNAIIETKKIVVQ